LRFPEVFELGECEYGVAVDSFLEHKLAGNQGLSEITTVSRNADFIKIFDICCGFNVYRDQTDPSSVVRQRPDDTIIVNGAVCMKNEAKGDSRDAEIACQELTDKLGPDALMVFPSNCFSIIGITSFPDRISIYSIDFHIGTNTFSTDHIKTLDMRLLDERVEFIQDIFKIAQWMSTVRKPRQEGFHLIPERRLQTTNGHHVTWLNGYLLKELKISASTRRVMTDMETKLRYINEIYNAHLPNIEWGTVAAPNILRVTRIGFKLRNAIMAVLITKEKAVSDIKQGEILFSP